MAPDAVVSDELSERINLPVSKALIRAIDDWRRMQPDIPSRAAAARALIIRGIEASTPDQRPPQRNEKKERAT